MFLWGSSTRSVGRTPCATTRLGTYGTFTHFESRGVKRGEILLRLSSRTVYPESTCSLLWTPFPERHPEPSVIPGLFPTEKLVDSRFQTFVVLNRDLVFRSLSTVPSVDRTHGHTRTHVHIHPLSKFMFIVPTLLSTDVRVRCARTVETIGTRGFSWYSVVTD